MTPEFSRLVSSLGDRVGRQVDIDDEHSRFDLYDSLLDEEVWRTQLLACLALDPDPAMTTSVLASLLEKVHAAERTTVVEAGPPSGEQFLAQRAAELSSFEELSRGVAHETALVRLVDGWTGYSVVRPSSRIRPSYWSGSKTTAEPARFAPRQPNGFASCSEPTDPAIHAGAIGPGGGIGEAAEGGDTVQILAPSETYDETVNGARMILAYDSGANAFVGTVENTTNGPLTRARVEVHLSNGTELGPTTPTDLSPGQLIGISLPSTAASFTDWTAHAEVGAAEGGEGASAAPAATYLTSSGISRGVYAGPELQVDDYYGDKLNDLEFALAYHAGSRSFEGRVKNEANEGLCEARIEVVFDGSRANSQSVVIPSLEIGERAAFNIDPDRGSSTTWTAETETSTCDNTPVHAGNAEGGEGGNESSGEGAGHEAGGSEGAGGESGSEGGGENEGPVVPIDRATVATINGLDTNVAYDSALKAFVGELTNNGTQPICDARLEIHVNRGSSSIELGPTVTADWAPGQNRTMVLGFDAQPSDTYSLHPEAIPCNGQAAASSTGAEVGAGEGSEAPGHEGGAAWHRTLTAIALLGDAVSARSPWEPLHPGAAPRLCRSPCRWYPPRHSRNGRTFAQ